MNPLQNLKPEQLQYIQQNTPVGSKLWWEAGNQMAAIQESIQFEIQRHTKK